MDTALSHIRVLDLSRILAGPWASQMLADFGAEVIKVERPISGDDTRSWGPPFATGDSGEHCDAAYFHSANRGKQSIAIDITTAEGQQLIHQLAAKADVLIENYKVDGLKKYGLDYPSLKKTNPSLIYCSVTGFGQDGPYKQRAGYDFMIQAMGGLMSMTGESDGQPMKVGDKLVQKDLAKTLKEISAKGTDGFYKGWVAKAIVDSSKAGKGIIVQADLDKYKTRELAPVECDYRGYHVVSAPPPSSGGVVICEIMNILEGYPMKELGYHSAQGLHYQIEAMRHAYVDRNSYLGDPDFVKNPIEQLLNRDYAAKLRAAIEPQKAGDSQAIKPGVAPHEGNNTTHYSIVDKWGNAVSVTYTLNDWFGAGVMASKTGVILNDEMDDFTSKVGVPNMYGLIQGEANAIAPGKAPLSSMSPTIVTKDGKTVMVVGTPVGSRIITATLLTMLNVIDYGMNIQEAVDAPRFHQQWMPETTNLENFAVSPDTQKILESWGHQFAGPQDANHLAAILVGAPSLEGKPVGNNRFYGANDPRRNTGLSLGY